MSLRRFLATRCALLCAALALTATASAETQSISLEPGWNAVWLRVEPGDGAPEKVFAGLPIDQVWCWFPTNRPVEFIDNPAEGLESSEGWRVWRTADDPQSFLNNLRAIQARRPYLIKIAGTANATLTVEGKPTVDTFRWQADSFNLRGFDVNLTTGGGAMGPFFEGVAAHAAQPVYRLQPSGLWTALAPSDPIRANEAYWVYSRGPSEFSGPVKVTTPNDGLNFSGGGEDKVVTITNNSNYTNTYTFNHTGPTNILVATQQGATIVWQPLINVTVTLQPGEQQDVRLGPDLTNGPTNPTDGTVTVTGPGTAVTVPVFTAPPGANTGAGTGGNPIAGLWVGAFHLKKVIDVNNSKTVPVPTPAQFDGRLILHVSRTGTVSLLKQVTVMRQIRPANQESNQVLITDDRKLSGFTGATLKDGKPFGLRMSAIGYDFAGTELPLTGAFGATLTGTIVVGRTLPTNPMRHRYHPDHDDLDAQFKPLPTPLPANFPPNAEEVWEIRRELTLTFDAPATAASPTAHVTRTGTYREKIINLHKVDIIVEGTFDLRRASSLPEINPAP